MDPNPAAVARARAYAPWLRSGDRFSHATAAALWGLPLPGPVTDLHVTAIGAHNRPRGQGVIGHRTHDAGVVLRDDLPVSMPGALFVELATELGLDDLVAVGDALILDPQVLDPRDIRPWATIDELAIASRTSRRGCRRARAALAFVRQGAESRPETLLRLLLVRAGLPEPDLNVEIRDVAGRLLGRADLVYRKAHVIVEYDGDHHRTSTAQYEKDMTRVERLIAAGWTVIRVRARGLFVTPGETAARVRAALAAAS
jgi:hypothetical protein